MCHLSISHTNVFRVKIPPAPGGRRKDPGALIKARLPEQGRARGVAGLAVCPAQLAQLPREYQEVRHVPRLPVFWRFVQGGAIKAKEKEKPGSPGVRQLESHPGQPARSDSKSRSFPWPYHMVYRTTLKSNYFCQPEY